MVEGVGGAGGAAGAHMDVRLPVRERGHRGGRLPLHGAQLAPGPLHLYLPLLHGQEGELLQHEQLTHMEFTKFPEIKKE